MDLENNTIKNNSIENSELSLFDLLFKIKKGVIFLFSKWKLILIFSLIGALIGLAVSLFEKPTYKAILTFAMEEDKGGSSGSIGGALGLASSLGIDLGGASGGGAFGSSNLTELMRSRVIVEKALLTPITYKERNFKLIDYYLQYNKLRTEWDKVPELKNIKFSTFEERDNFTTKQDSLIKIIYEDLIQPEKLNIAQKDRKITIILIQVVSEDELFSKLFCEAISRETSRFYIETKTKKARINVNILQNQLDSVKKELHSFINGAASDVDNVYNLNPAFLSKGTSSKKKQIEIQSNTSILTNLVVQLELSKINLRKETPLIQTIDKPILPLEKIKFGKRRSIMLGFFIAFMISNLVLIFHQLYRRYLI